MAGSKTAFLSQAILDHVLGGASYAPPSNIWFVLSSAAFDPAATGAVCFELTAGDYNRLGALNDSAVWAGASAAAPSLKSNNNDLGWAEATSDWGTPQSVYVADAAEAGNLLYGADLTGSTDVAVGVTFKILAGAFVFSED